jgi:hypothetical protein
MIIDHTTPKAITLAAGPHNEDPDKIMGNTPKAAAIAVRKMGRNLLFPA